MTFFIGVNKTAAKLYENVYTAFAECYKIFIKCNICNKYYTLNTLFEQVRQEIAETTAPSQPFVMGAWRDVKIGFDTTIAQALDQCFGAEILLRPTTQIEVVHLLVELIRTGEDSIIGGLYVKSEDGSAEGTHVGELVHVGQHHVESLVTTP